MMAPPTKPHVSPKKPGPLVIRHETNRARRRPSIRAYDTPANMNAALVVLIDADGQHDPAEIPLLITPVETQQADIVVGSRFLGVRSEIPRWRVMGQHALTVATNRRLRRPADRFPERFSRALPQGAGIDWNFGPMAAFPSSPKCSFWSSSTAWPSRKFPST